MHRTLLGLLVLSLAFATSPALSAQDGVREEFETLARLVPCLPFGVVFYDRDPASELRGDWMTAAERAALETYAAKRRTYTTDELTSLCAHPEPRVRQLAMCALYAHFDPRRVLPLWRASMTDEGVGFPLARHALGLSFAILEEDRPSIEELRASALGEPQTPGTIARGFVELYLARAFYPEGSEDPGTPPGWDRYWGERAHRDHCLSWFQLELEYATGASTPFRAERAEGLRALRARLDALESPDREWTLLWLAKPEDHPLVSAEERLELARGLGSEAILGFLRGEAPTDDPDMVLRSRHDVGRAQLVRFLLAHAEVLLDADAADELLALEERHLQLSTTSAFSVSDPLWSIAAAKLRGDRGLEILNAALERYDAPHMFGQEQRARLMRALWDLAPAESLPRILDWYFASAPAELQSGYGRQSFTRLLGAGDVELLRAILLDPRLAKVDWTTLEILARVANRLSGREVVPEDELRRIWHPYGASHFEAWHERGLREYPEQTQAVDRQLDELRAKLRLHAEG